MSLLDVALDYYRTQVALTSAAQQAASRLWLTLQPSNLDASWLAFADQMLVIVASAQLLAAQQADPYVDDSLGEQVDRSTAPSPPAPVVSEALAGVASDGRGLDSLLYQSVITVKRAIARDLPIADALGRGEATLARIVGAQVQDAGRVATSIAINTRPQVKGWARMLNTPSCARCVILAGRVYRWSEGFRRHPGCDCVHIPSTEDAEDDLRTDPKAYFRGLSRADQDKYFGKDGAQAILDGADMNQIVNAHRGASGLSQPGRLTADEQANLGTGKGTRTLDRVDVYGRQVAVTREGTTLRGIAGRRLADVAGASKTAGDRVLRASTPRLMPEAIAEIAGEVRDERIRLLRLFGYII